MDSCDTIKGGTKILFIFFLGGLLSFSLFGKAYGQSGDSSIRVVVTSEEEGTTIISSTVILRNEEGDTLRVGVTDVHGFSEFARLQSGSYEVQISFIGYQTHVEQVELGPDEIQIIQVSLDEVATELGTVTVSVERGAVRRTAGRQTVTVADLNRVPSPGPGGDLAMFLQTMPGVVSTGDRGGDLFIRGGTPTQNLILVDNIPVIKPFHISNLFSAFPSDIVSSVDVYAGGFGAEYTNATSSVMDVNLRQGNMRQSEAEVAFSPYMVSARIEGPIKRDDQSLLLMGRYSTIEEFGPDLTGEEVPLLFYDFNARYSKRWDGLSCNVTALHTYDRGRISPERNLRLTWSNTAAGLRCLGFTEELQSTVDFTVGFSLYTSSEIGVDDTGRTSDVSMGFMRVDNSANLFGLPSKIGFQLAFTGYEAELDAPFAELTPGGRRFVDLDSSFDELITSLSAYTSLVWKPSRNVTVTPGITTQMRLSDLRPTAEPRLQVLWSPGGDDRHEVSMSAGRFFQLREGISDERDAGTVFYVYKPIDREEPLPQSLHAILGYRRQVTNSIAFSVESFLKSHQDLPVSEWTREPANTIRTARAESIARGVDLQVEADFFPFFFSAGYGLAEVTYEADSEDLVAWLDQPVFRFNPAHDRRHQLNVATSYQFSGFKANANWQFSSGNPFTKLFAIDFSVNNLPVQNPLTSRGRAVTLFNEPFDGRLPSFNRLDVSLSRNFVLNNSISLEAELGAVNTYNVRNVFFFDVNTFEQVDQLPFLPYLSISTKLK